MRTTLGFLLYDWLGVEALTQRPRFREHSRDTFESVLDMSERLARERFAPANRRADVEEPQFDGERVTLPQSSRDAVMAYAASGLLAAGHDEESGGMQLPCVIDTAANAFFPKASIGLSAFAMLTYANANLLLAHGTPRQRHAFATPQQQGRFFGTMCLSEPQAGSSLGDISTRAVPDGEGFESEPLGPRYRIKGNKMWISGGEHDLGENIVHLVLAKIPGPDGQVVAGAKGISLFVVPRMLLDAEGRPTGERNDIALAGLNHKLGYRGIPNTLLNFGEGRFALRAPGLDGRGAGAIGYRVGAPGEGLRLMFHMMNEARINVGLGATMLAYAGYLASLDYARHRPQGRIASGDGKDPKSPQVPIVWHGDVKRMLLAQKAYCEGGLALGLYCARLVDEKRTGEPAAAAEAAALLELLTPVAKSWPSEWGLEANNLAIQVHGGYGYTRDFAVEQHWRDNRLNMIHEGTHGIQALDLLGRKIVGDGGRAFALWRSRVDSTLANARQEGGLAGHSRELGKVVAMLEGAAQSVQAQGNRARAFANATPFMQAFGHAIVAWLWLDIALGAARALREGAPLGADFYHGKMQAAHYFFNYEAPRIPAWLRTVTEVDSTCVDMQDAWF